MADNFIGSSFRIEERSFFGLVYAEYICFAKTELFFYLVLYFFGLSDSVIAGLSIKPFGFYRICWYFLIFYSTILYFYNSF